MITASIINCKTKREEERKRENTRLLPTNQGDGLKSWQRTEGDLL